MTTKKVKPAQAETEEKGFTDMQVRMIFIALNGKGGIRSQSLPFKLRYRLQRISDKCQPIATATDKVFQDILKEKYSGKFPTEPNEIADFSKVLSDAISGEAKDLQIDKIPGYLLESVRMTNNQEIWLSPIIDYSQMEEPQE